MRQKKITEENAIYVLVCSWSEQSGDGDVEQPDAFTSPVKAHNVMIKRVLKYIEQHHGIKKTGEFNQDNVFEVMVNGDIMDTKQALMSLTEHATDIEVNVDENGTWARWKLSKVYVE